MKELPTSLDGPLFFRIASFFIYNCILIPLAFITWFCVYGMKIKGRKNFKGHRKGFIAANHCQYIEPGFTAAVAWPKKLLFSADENNITRKGVGLLIRLLRTFGIPEKNFMSIAAYIKKALERNCLVHFYPEGVLSWRSQTPGPFFDGVFFFAFLNNAPVFPLVEVLHDRPIRRVLPWWPPQTTYVIGAPFYPDDFKKSGLSRREQVRLMSQAVHDFMTATIAKEGGCTTLPERRQAPLP